MKCDVTTLENSEAGSIDLADEVFGLPSRADILQRMVVWQLHCRQASLSMSKRAFARASGSSDARKASAAFLMLLVSTPVF